MSIMLAALRSPRCIWPPHAASTVWSNCCWHAASIATCAPKMAIPPPRSHANAATSAPRRCSDLPNTKRATVLDPAARDEVFMRHALLLANRARHRSEEHTSELQSLMRISYAVFCLKKKKTNYPQEGTTHIRSNARSINTIRQTSTYKEHI